MPLLDAWWVHQAALDAGKKVAAHRLWQVEGVATHFRTLCGQVWLKEQVRLLWKGKDLGHLVGNIREQRTQLVLACLRCQRIQHRYTAHDEAKHA